MPKQSKYIQDLIAFQEKHQDLMRQIIEATEQEQEELINKLTEEEKSTNYTFAQRLADKVASFGGSWTFIISFFTFVTIWMIYNSIQASQKPFDPYPFILLNLVLSCLAAIQAPVILMSQNRRENRDRIRAQNDYMINLKAELKNRGVDKKLDLLINKLFTELLEIQGTQIKKLDSLEKVMAKSNAFARKTLPPTKARTNKDTAD